MSWQDVLSGIQFWDSETSAWGNYYPDVRELLPGDQEYLIQMLSNLYHGSPKAAEVIEDALARNGSLRFSGTIDSELAYTIPNTGSHVSYVALSTSAISQYFIFNENGEVIREQMATVLMHELIHYAYAWEDNAFGDPTDPVGNGFDFKGPVVRLANEIFEEMGSTYQEYIRATYWATFIGGDENLAQFELNASYTEGNKVDVVHFRGSGDDVLDTAARTDEARDLLFGLGGNDTLRSGAGADYLYGGEDNDVIEGGEGADFIDGGEGVLDLVSYQLSSEAVTVNLTTSTGSGGHAQGDRIKNVESVQGSDYSDTFIGNVKSNTFHGGQGRDQVRYDDVTQNDFYGLGFFGSPQLGFVISSAIVEATDYFMGIEEVTFSNHADHLVLTGNPLDLGTTLSFNALGGGTGPRDTLDLRDLSGGVIYDEGLLAQQRLLFLNFEILYFSQFDDNVTHSISNSIIHLGAGSDTLVAAGDGSVVYGGANTDTMVGGDGNQVLVGNDDSVADIMMGGGGRDVFVAGDGDIILDASVDDRLAVSSTQWVQGEATRDEGSSGPYTNEDGHTFTLDGTTLTVEAGGSTITIQDFQDGDLGITLREPDDDDDDEPGDDDGPGPGGGGGGFPFPLGPFHNPPASPLVLDLDDDGLEITALTGSSVHFDLDASGSRERTGWVGGDDGFLVFDANANGAIDDGHELFGNPGVDGFQVLSFYDGRSGGNFYTDPTGGTVDSFRQNGVIDDNDAIWSSLQVWRDLDQDGQSEAGELFSLDSLGILSINLSYASVSRDIHEHEIRQESSAQTTTGAIEISDVWFTTDRTNTIHDYDPNAVGFAIWPDLHAIGGIPSLRHAMSLDAELADAIASFIDDAETLSLDGLQERFADILLTWAGVDDHALDGRGEYFPDARVLEFLELVHDRDYLQLAGMNAGTNDPGPAATQMLLAAFETARDGLMLQFLSQLPTYRFSEAMTEGEAYQASRFGFLSPALSYDIATGRHSFDAVQFIRSIDPLDTSDADSVRSVIDFLEFAPALGRMLDMEPEAFLSHMRAAVLEAGRADLRAFVDWFVVQPEDGPPSIRGAVRVATENQSIASSALSDLILVGDDVGTLTIARDSSADRIVLSETFDGAAWALTVEPSTGDVTISFATLGVTLVLQGYLSGSVSEIARNADVIYFSNGAVIDQQAVRAATNVATNGDDLLVGTVFDETLDGLGGADFLSGGDGQDTLRGGDGNDNVSGGRGSDIVEGGLGDDQLGTSISSDNIGADTYIIRAGDGHDTLVENADAGRNVVLLEDTDATAVNLSWSGADLILTFTGRPDDSLTLVGFRNGETVSSFRFANDVAWTYRQTVDAALLQEASPGDDTLTGTSAHDTLVGGLGNDTIRGGSSSFTQGDLFLYRQGDGHDTIYASYSFTADELVLREIAPADVTVTRTSDNAVLTFAGGGSITLSGQFNSLGWNVLERIVFDDGTVWTERDLVFSTQSMLTAPTVTGTTGADTLDGTSGRDVIDGGAGNDLLRGGNGADTYVFGVGSGQDVISDQGRDDAVEADVVLMNVAPQAVTVSRVADNVVLTLATGDSLTLSNFFNANLSSLNPTNVIERIVFSDGTHWDAAQIASAAWTRGTNGVDNLVGRGGSDTVFGGLGDDLLNGASGDDIYLVRSGDGHDVINELNSGGEDAVFFEDATLADVRVVLVTAATGPDYLRIERLDGTGSVTIPKNGQIEAVRFSDGASLDIDQLAAIAAVQGAETGETLFGTGGADHIFGNGGADELRGEGGFDAYHWSRGDGDDVVMDFGSDQELGQLHLHGIDPSLVVLSRIPTSNPADGALYDLVVTIQPLMQTDIVETITISRFVSGYGNQLQGITGIVFDDGTVWSQANLVMQSSLAGTAAADALTGTSLDDRITGGEGADDLEGQSGSDTYFWSSGDGDDTIFDGGYRWDADTLRLTNVQMDDVAFIRQGDDLLIGLLATDEMITVTGQFWTLDPEMEGNPDYNEGVERIVFADARQLDRAAILTRLESGGGYNGTLGDDLISGDGGDNLLSGFAGHDVLTGGEGADRLYGGAGDDTLAGGIGDDELVGGSGADIYIYEAGEGHDLIVNLAPEGAGDILQLGAGITQADVSVSRVGGDAILSFADGGSIVLQGQFQGGGVSTVSFATGPAWTMTDIFARYLQGADTPAGDHIEGSGNNDVIQGGFGDDELRGGGGDDHLQGQENNDVLAGGAGVDLLDGGSGTDTVDYSGAAAGMRAQLNSSASTNDGDGGTDTFAGIENLTGSAFNDVLIGDGGLNLLRGGLGSDTLLGLAGNDILWGGEGATNQLQGGLGDDHYLLQANDTVVEFAGEGVDTIEARINTYVLANNVENLVFTGAGHFTATGNAGDNTITGGAGDDNLRGRGGVDVLNGGNGLDTVDYSLAAAGVTARLDLMKATNDGDGATDTFSGIENLTGSIFNDLLFGNNGANVLRGGVGSDTLLGLGGNDVLYGGSSGNNQMQGGLGDDRYVLDAFDTCVEFAGEGIDTIESRIGSYNMGANIENLIHTGPGGFVGRGNELDNHMTGGAFNDILRGWGGNDTLIGGLGNDEVQVRGAKAEYTVTAEGSGWRIVDSVAGRDGSTYVEGIELVRFGIGNTTTALTYPPPAPAVLETSGKEVGPEVLPGLVDDRSWDDAFVLPAMPDDQPLVLPGMEPEKFADAPLVLPGMEQAVRDYLGLAAHLPRTGDWMIALDPESGLFSPAPHWSEPWG